MVHLGLSLVWCLALSYGAVANAAGGPGSDSGTVGNDSGFDSGAVLSSDSSTLGSDTGGLFVSDSGATGQAGQHTGGLVTDSGTLGGTGSADSASAGGDSGADSAHSGDGVTDSGGDSFQMESGTRIHSGDLVVGGTGTVFGGDSAALNASAGVVINEFLPNPDSTDDGLEWVELLNTGTVSISLSGWTFKRATSSTWSTRYTFSSYTLQAGERLLLGGELVSAADLNLATGSYLAMGQGSSSGDAIQLLDNTGVIVDTVIYGPNNTDGFLDDSGAVATSVAPSPGSGESVGRLPDGSDTDQCGVDFVAFNTPSPGADNGAGGGMDTGDTGAGGTGGTGSAFPAGSVIINEFLPDSSAAGGDKGHEWIEFVNTTAGDIDLLDWSVERATSSSFSTRYTFDAVTISPGTHLVLGGEFVSGVDVQLATGTGLELGNASSSGDVVRLVDPVGGIIDTVIYGPDNSAGFQDDDGLVTNSVAPDPSADMSLARVPDASDTNASGADFSLISSPTLGGPNVDPCGSKAADAAGLVINEFIPNPASTDTDYEWLELYNGGSSTINISGWVVNTGTTSFTKSGVIPIGTEISPGDFLVIGQTETSIPEVDVAAPGFSLGNAGSGNADGVRLEDCEGTVVDTAIYGDDNTNDQWVDDTAGVATSLAPNPKEGVSIARVDDGVDTDMSAVDFEVPSYSTPGESNDAAPTTCGGPTSGIVVNEFVSNPVGADSEAMGEWVEIFHGGTEDIDLEGWGFQVATSSFSTKYTWEETTIMAPGDFILIGDLEVTNADIFLSMSLPNATSNSDALRIVDCKGFAADTVVYGSPNSDEIMDDTNTIATNTAVSPDEGSGLARVQDGYDTNNSRFDFVLTTEQTPGAPNPELEPIVCAPDDGSVKLNEALMDPEGSDSDALAEWVEFYNTSADEASIAGWWLATDDEFEDLSLVLPGNAIVAAEDWLVLGQELSSGVDVIVPLSLGNGSGGDGIRLFDCEGKPVDTLVYGDEENDDAVLDDDGEAPVNLPNPSESESVARVEDGVDTNQVSDWKIARRTTPGESNLSEGLIDTGGEPGGCNKKGKDGAPSGCSSGATPEEGSPDTGGCNTVPLPLGGMEFLAGCIAFRRRRREV